MHNRNKTSKLELKKKGGECINLKSLIIKIEAQYTFQKELTCQNDRRSFKNRMSNIQPPDWIRPLQGWNLAHKSLDEFCFFLPGCS